MGKTSNSNLKRLLPSVALATFYVAVAPVAIVWALGVAGILRSPLFSIPAALVLSFGIAALGAAWWKKRPASADVLFGDLMIWGWIRRWRTERRLNKATTLLGIAGAHEPSPKVSRERQAELLEELATALEARDPYTAGHSRRVARYSVLIAKGMGLPAETVAQVRTAAAIHDVGKINTPREVLNKPGKLTDEEYDIIKRHPADSALMSSALGEEITAMVRHHHERLDGTGYPSRMAGDAVPLGSRIIAVADTFDALTSNRAYRNGKSHKIAMNILSKEAGTQLDPDAVRAFLHSYSDRRALGWWNGVTVIPERLLSWLGAGLGGAASTAKLATAAALTALLGTPVLTTALPPGSARADAGNATKLAAVLARSAHSGSYGSVPGLKTGDLGSLVGGAGGSTTGGGSAAGGSTPNGGSSTGSGGGKSSGSGSGSGSASGGSAVGGSHSSGGSGSGTGSGSGSGSGSGTGSGSGSGTGTGSGGGVVPTVTNTVTTAAGGVPSTVSGAVGTVTGAAGGVTSTAGGAVGTVTGAAGGVTSGVPNTAGGAVGGVTGKVGGVTGKLP